MITADFYPATKRAPGVLVVNVVIDGQRTHLRDLPCADKRTARRIAAEVNAQPWNF